MSWERTLYDLRRAFAASDSLGTLLRARHLVVTFSADGALWLERDGHPHRAELVYDAENAEGAWSEREQGEAIGSLTGVAAGLASMRNLRQFGHGLVEGPPPSGYPVDRIAEVLGKGAHAFAHAILPWDSVGEQLISFVERSQAPIDGPPPAALLGLARLVVVQGTTALKRLPHARFGKLVTADLAEIEALRHIRRPQRRRPQPRSQPDSPNPGPRGQDRLPPDLVGLSLTSAKDVQRSLEHYQVEQRPGAPRLPLEAFSPLLAHFLKRLTRLRRPLVDMVERREREEAPGPGASGA